MRRSVQAEQRNRNSRKGLAAAAFPSPEEPINFVMIAPLRIASGITRVGRRGEKPKKKSVERRGKCRIAEVLEHVSDLRGSDAGKGKWWKPVFGKKLGAGGFMAVLSRATLKFAEEKELVSVESVGRVPVKVTVVERCELGDANVVAGFFPGLARGGDAGRLTHIGPAARERPAPVFNLADEENAAIVKNCGANVDFGSRIACLTREERGRRLIGRKHGARRHDFGSDGADFVIALHVKFILAIGKT